MAWRGLSVLRFLEGGPKLTRQIAEALGEPSTNTSRLLRTLSKRSLVTSCEGNHQITEKGLRVLGAGHEVTSGPSVGKAMTRQGTTLRAKAWRAMRIREVFSLDDLMMLICDEGEKAAAQNLGGYIRALVAAGYLAPMRRQGSGIHLERWRLTRAGNTGPEAPAWNKAKGVVTDVNTGEIFNVHPKQFVTSVAGVVPGGKA